MSVDLAIFPETLAPTCASTLVQAAPDQTFSTLSHRVTPGRKAIVQHLTPCQPACSGSNPPTAFLHAGPVIAVLPSCKESLQLCTDSLSALPKVNFEVYMLPSCRLSLKLCMHLDCHNSDGPS